MKVVKAGAAIMVVGVMAVAATSQGQKTRAPMEPPVNEVNVTNDMKNRYGEVQIAVNPKNPNNLVYANVQLGFSYECQRAKNPDCDIVQMRIGGGGFGGGGGGGAAAAGGGARPPATGPLGVPAPGAAPGAPPAAPPAGGAPRPGAAGGGAPSGFGGGFPQPKGLFFGKGFDVVGVFTSFDRGKTWKRANVPVPAPAYPDLHGWGDPSVVAAPDGTFYLSYDNMNWGTPDKPLTNAIVGVSKSTDGGRTWSAPVASGTPIDGPKMVVDLSTGTVFEASSGGLGANSTGKVGAPSGQGGGDRWLVSSKDGVKWSTPQRIGGSDGTRSFAPGIGGIGMSAAHGTIAASFRGTSEAACKYYDGGAAPCLIFQTSTDLGATWTRHRLPEAGSGGTTMAADPSTRGHFTVVVLSERDSQLQVYQTRDSGKTWSGPTTIAKDATKNHYHPWAAYSPDGVFGIVWRSRTPIAGQAAPVGPLAGAGPSLPFDVWGAISRDGGATFSAPLKINKAQSPAPQSGPFGNNGDDYVSIVIDNGYAYFGWADWRPGDRQGFFRAVKLSAFTK